MRAIIPSLTALTLALSACGGPSGGSARTASADSATAALSRTDQAMTTTRDSRPEGAYRLVGVVDPEMDSVVAFAMKVPRDWRMRQQFTRRWVGASPQNQIYLSLNAPDGSSQIEYLPSRSYIHAEGPLVEENNASARSMGMPIVRDPNDLTPMPPVAYIRQVLLPQLAQQGFQIRNVGNEQEAPQTRDEYQRIVSRGSVDGVLPNGNKARVECRIFLSAQQQQGNTFYSWNAIPSITQTSGDLAAAYAHTLVAQQSIVSNPNWLQRNQALQNRGAQMNSDASRRQHEATMGQIDANTSAMTQQHNQRMGDIQRWGDANTARHNERMDDMDRNQAAFENRMASGDRQQEIAVDGIRGESKYVDPSTGQRVKVEDGYNHVYRDRQNPNQYYGSDTPINAGQVDWQELQKVSLRDY